MHYISLEFVLFVAITFLLYYVLPKKMRGIVLLSSSLVFYGFFNVKYLIFLLFTAISTFFTAKFLPRVSKKRLLVTACIAVNAGIWFLIKYLPSMFGVIENVFSKLLMPINMPEISLLVPVGISYFTLQAISYLVDVKSGRVEAEKHFWKYLLFLSWFPAIVQGPISRYSQLKPQLLNTEKINFDKIRQGLLFVLIGLVKKMVIADRLAIFVGTCFSEYEGLGGITLYLGAVCYSVQLFADFSGCIDICRGVSKLFGVEMINNFARPYLARSIKEFWGKWHISFSTWLKDYIYIPLGGNRKGTFRKYLNIIITFVVSGIWHGVGLNFTVWGFLHAIYQVVGNITAGLRKKIKNLIGLKENSISERIYQTVITFNLVTFAWIFFRAGSLLEAFSYIKNMFFNFAPWELFDQTLFSFDVSQNAFTLIFLHLIAWFAIECLTKKQEEGIDTLVNSHLIIRWIIYIVLIFDIVLFGAYGSQFDASGFLYGGF